MTHDQIDEIGIDKNGSLYICPTASRFPYIYREAMEVGWNKSRLCLFSPKPREWSYLTWFQQLVAAAREQGVVLEIAASTRWSDIPSDLRRDIESLPSV